MHSARYDENYSLDGKRVAVIGIGSSGVQIIANIARSVEKLYCWIRSPTWITAGFAQRFAGPGGENFSCKASFKMVRTQLLTSYTDTEEQKRDFERDPEKLLKYCKGIENELNQRFKFILQGTPEAAAAKDYATKEMSLKLAGNKELIDAIVPKDFGVGCRRPTVSLSGVDCGYANPRKARERIPRSIDAG
jgi:cation diffusion facilitator CzcD-associated flavoprotein CzcO